MSDDIVTRLHEVAFEVDSTVPIHLKQAADEIERLRAEVTRLTLLANLWESEFKAAVEALTGKTVRGE